MYPEMKILLSEAKNKLTREIIELSREEVLEGIVKDQGWVEVFEMYYPSSTVRLFFDVDFAGTATENILDLSLKAINATFGTTDADWAICCGSREKKVSYHILSKRYKITLEALRKVAAKLKSQHSWFDDTLLYITLESNHELGFLRLPNQSKDSINKPAPPMVILQGDLADFLVTDIEHLEDVPGLVFK
jgi:hypothetical protein